MTLPGFPSLSINVTYLGSFTEPPVVTSVLAGPRPSSFHAPSAWFAAIAPPHKNSPENSYLIFLLILYIVMANDEKDKYLICIFSHAFDT